MRDLSAPGVFVVGVRGGPSWIDGGDRGIHLSHHVGMSGGQVVVCGHQYPRSLGIVLGESSEEFWVFGVPELEL
ncbi:MAG TPA: hypothetical protein VG184_13710 [Acidimicrobiales bacterium]|nr:hypothetical protein [Acidimicrobiales bacterium]